jgi:hypothetical protein
VYGLGVATARAQCEGRMETAAAGVILLSPPERRNRLGSHHVVAAPISA